nr:rcc01693 family protein [Aurantimonas sp. 22II-16-19i]
MPADATGRETACVDTPAAFPWEAAMQVGFGVLRLSSEAFWTLTPRELASVFGAARRGTAPTPGDLARLMRRFPDRAPQKTDPPGQNG